MRISKKDIEVITENYKKKTEKNCYKINICDKTPSFLDNKLGGDPYLPIGEQYPTDKKGRPMPLLLQINLKEINLKGFPKDGILEVFTNMEYPMEYAVKIFDEGLEYQTDLPKAIAYVNDEECEYIIKKPTYITLQKDIMHMPFSNYRCQKILIKIIKERLQLRVSNEEINKFVNDFDNIYNIWCHISNELTYHSLNIGGYPNFCQEDPRPNLKPKKNECLFSIDSVGYEKYIDLVDSGIIWGFISKEDLKNKNFKETFIDFDFC